MKKLTIILILISNIALSQTLLDTIFLETLNKYRSSKNLKEVKWDDAAYKASNHHSKYLVSKENILTHYEEEDTLSMYKTPSDRYKFYGGKKNVGEVSQSAYRNVKNESDSLYRLADKILDSWIKSPNHKKIILDPNIKSCGISTIYNTLSKSNLCRSYSYFSIMVVVK